MKSVVIYEQAKKMILEGYSLDAIVELLKDTVSRKTLFNWMKEHNWEEQRKNRMEADDDLQKELLEIAKASIREAKANPTAHNIFAVVKAISALKLLQGVNIKNEKEDKPTGIKEETIREIEREILGIG